MDKIPQSSVPPTAELSPTPNKPSPQKWGRVWGRFISVVAKKMVKRCIATLPENKKKGIGVNKTPIIERSSIKHLAHSNVDQNEFNAILKAQRYEKSGMPFRAEWLRAKTHLKIIKPSDKEERLFQELGKGGEGRADLVFRGINGPLEVKKTLHDSDRDSETEIALLKRLNHPNIIKILPNENPALAEDGTHMMKNGGVSLDKLTPDDKNSTPLSLNLFISIAKQMASVLDYLGKEQVLHRDIKPENIVIDPAGHVSLIDFGMAYDGQTDTYCNPRGRGTPPFMEPDALGKFTKAKFTDTADMFAAGQTLFNLITGEVINFPDFYHQQGLEHGHKDASWDAYKKDQNLSKTIVTKLANALAGDPKKTPPAYPEIYAKLVIDLILRMMEPDPKLRITPEEFKNHLLFSY